MTTTMKRSLLMVSHLLAFGFAISGPAFASQSAGGWWSGGWVCNIDGRPARMHWAIVRDRWQGHFSDNGSAWVPLTQPQQDQRGLFFRHADGNQWFLAVPVNNRTRGFTTWNGQRFALSCRR